MSDNPKITFCLVFFLPLSFLWFNSVSGTVNASQHPVYLRRCGSMIPWPTIIPRLLFTADLVWGCIQTQRKPRAPEHWLVFKKLKTHNYPLYISFSWTIKIASANASVLSKPPESARGCDCDPVNQNISLPSTAITAGMVHNIHRISIIRHLWCPDIQIKYVPKAIDSLGREGTGGPPPPVERWQIAGHKPSQISTKFGRNQRGDRRRGALGSPETQQHHLAKHSSSQSLIK